MTIGLPQMSASGFPGSRVDAMRAGMRTSTLSKFGFAIAQAFISGRKGVKKSHAAEAFGCCKN
jgi:hypothetical protein